MWSKPQLTAGKTPVLYEHEKQVAVYEKVALTSANTELSGWIYLTSQRLCFVDNRHPEENSGCIDRAQIVRSELLSGLLKMPSVLVEVEQAKTAKTSRSWVCEICFFSNKLEASETKETPVCLNCGIPTENPEFAEETMPAADTSSSTTKGSTNTCPRCTFENHPYLSECEMCGMKLRESKEKSRLGSLVELAFKEAKQLYTSLQSASEVQQEAQSRESTPSPPTTTPALPGIHRLGLTPSTSNSVPDPLSGLSQDAKELDKMLEAQRRVCPTYYELYTISGPVGPTTTAQLARQLSSFLDENKLLESQGGLMSLHHVFAAFNRARYDTVSAANLVKALELAPSLGMPVKVRTLKNGTKLLDSNNWTSPQDRLVNWLRGREQGSTALSIASHFKWSLLIALEELEQAEIDGIVCRDETKSGVLWWIAEDLLKAAKDLRVRAAQAG